jgi:ADP-heptose:LPS heptosyltransferase
MRADLSGQHKGIKGLSKLYQELKTAEYDYVADFHSILRSHYIRFRFKLDGIPTASINKGRKEKKKLTQKTRKTLVSLKSGFTRYYEVLEKLGFTFNLHFESVFGDKTPGLSEIISLTGEKKDIKWLGIAPFAKHEGKIYPRELQERVIEHFASDNRVKVFVFGGGAAEKKIITRWTEKYPSIISMVSQLNISQELILMSRLDVMYSMDSANMHLASLVNTPVVSVWGATHTYAGFMGWNQSNENAVQVDLACRPCSIYGQKKCYRGDYACLYNITPKMIIDRIEKNLF